MYFTYVWTQKWILGKSAKGGTAGMREETVGVHLTESEQRTERDRHAGREKQECCARWEHLTWGINLHPFHTTADKVGPPWSVTQTAERRPAGARGQRRERKHCEREAR